MTSGETINKIDQIKAHLSLLGQLYSLEGPKEKFRAKSFQDAVGKITCLFPDGDTLTLTKIDGIGPSIIEVITQVLETGTSDRLQSFSTKYPLESFTMTVVEGIGPKTALKFHADGIHNFDELVTAAVAGKTGRHTANILAANSKSHGRVPYEIAIKIAAKAIELIQQTSNHVYDITICGSLRRQTIDSKDIDLVIVSPEITLPIDFINQGSRKASGRFTIDNWQMKCDVWFIEPWYRGSALVYTTGSKEHCVALRSLAKSKGYVLNEYGIFHPGQKYTSENQLAGLTEESVYKFLGLCYQDPNTRDGNLLEISL